MRALRWIIPLMAMALIFSGAGLVSAQATNTISGTVIDKQTGGGIEGAVVEVEGTDLSAKTGVDGAYQITGVPAGEYSVSASADGYESETETGVEVSDGVATSLDFALQPVDTEEETDAGKQPGRRKGYVGTFTMGEGSFTVTTKKGKVKIRIPDPEGDLVAGAAVGALVDGAKVAVLVEFQLEGGGPELVRVARKIVVKPKPQLPVVGAVSSVETNEEGIRILTILRFDGTTKKVQLSRGVDSPENGELVTVFPGRGRGARGSREGDNGNPPVAKGLVKAAKVRERLEGFLQDLTAENSEVPALGGDIAQLVADVAAILEVHVDKHVKLLEKLSRKKRPEQVEKALLKALEKAQRGRSQAKQKASEARTKAGPPAGRGRGKPDAAGRGNTGRGNADSADQKIALRALDRLGSGAGRKGPPSKDFERTVFVDKGAPFHGGPGDPDHEATDAETKFKLTQGGIRWPEGSEVRYSVTATGCVDDCSDAVSQVNAALDTWELTGITFTQDNSSPVENPCGGGRNSVSWDTFDGSGGILAVASVCRYVSTKEIVGFHIIFDSGDFWSDSGAASKFDIQATMAHEGGHAIGLGHVVPEKTGHLTMHPFIALGDIRFRTLGCGERLGINAAYGETLDCLTLPGD